MYYVVYGKLYITNNGFALPVLCFKNPVIFFDYVVFID